MLPEPINRDREQYDRRKHGQNEAQLPERTGNRTEPALPEGKHSDQEKAQVLGQIPKRREFEHGYAVWNDDPQQVAGRRQRQREEGNFGERELLGRVVRQALRPVFHNRPPREVAQVEYEQHHDEPHLIQGKQTPDGLMRYLMASPFLQGADYEDVNERGYAEPQQPVHKEFAGPLAFIRPGREIPREQEEQSHEVCLVQHQEQIQAENLAQVLQHYEYHHPCAQVVGEVQAFPGFFCRKAYRPVPLNKSAG